MVRANFRGATASPQVEQEAPADEAYLAFQEVLGRINDGFETGELSEEQADDLEAQALTDYQAILANELGIDPDDLEDEEDEDGDYAAGTDLATFSSGSSLGAAVLEMGQAQGYETVEDLVYDLADVTGFDPEDLADLLSGAATVDDFEDPELAAHTLANAFPDTAEDDEAYEGFMQLAASEAGYEVEDGEAEEGSVDYSRYRLDLERDSRINRIEAEFAAAQEASAIQTELYELTREADLGFQEGWLPPTAYKAIIGEFELDTDRFAAFSAVCDSNEVPAETELYAMRKQLEVFRRCGPFVKFGATVEEDLTPDELQDYKAAKASTSAYAKRINQYVGE